MFSRSFHNNVNRSPFERSKEDNAGPGFDLIGLNLHDYQGQGIDGSFAQRLGSAGDQAMHQSNFGLVRGYYGR